ncbi:MAG TPA: phosphonopyruvate decarboxylase [Pseudonocardiaceae bacterium]
MSTRMANTTAVDVSGEDVLSGLRQLGVDTLVSVPCSYFNGIYTAMRNDPAAITHLPAVNEGSAVGVAAGVHLAGRTPAVMLQNSGFGNLINPLTSLLLPYRIPALFLMSLRGHPEPGPGEEQHRWMGRVVPSWLDSLEIPHWTMGTTTSWPEAIGGARTALRRGQPAFLLFPSPVLPTERPPRADAAVDGAGMTRRAAVQALLSAREDDYLMSTTGYLSRELHDLDDSEKNFYMQGSMGHLASIALGIAVARPDTPLVVLDGDGALLMHIGVLATIGEHRPARFIHVVFDNHAYESTGGQPVGGTPVDFEGIASACGITVVGRARTAAEVHELLGRARQQAGPTLLVIEGMMSDTTAGRASQSLALPELATRFAAAIRTAPVSP